MRRHVPLVRAAIGILSVTALVTERRVIRPG